MTEKREDRWGSLGLAVAIGLAAAAFYWLGNNRTSLWDRDEPRFAEPAKEMLLVPRWDGLIVPRLNGELHLHKPPWCYWQIAAAYVVFGVNESAARFFSGLWAGASVGLIFWFLGRSSRPAGAVAAASAATSALLLVTAKLAIADASLLFFTLTAVLALREVFRGNPSTWPRLVFWVSLGVAALIKGPAVLSVVGPLAVGLLLVDRDRRWFRRLGWLWGPIFTILIAAPWYVAVYNLSGGALAERFWHYDIWRRVFQPLEGHRGFPGFYVVTALGGLFPWSAFLAPLSAFAWRQRRDRQVKFLLCWLIGPTLVLETLRTKMAHYWLPMAPAYALLLGLAAEQWLGPERARWAFWSGAVRFVAAVGFFAIGVGAVLFSVVALKKPLAGMILLAGVCVVVSFGGYVLARRSLPRTALAFTAGMAAVTLAVAFLALPQFEQFKLTKLVADRMRAAARADQRFAVFWGEESLLFYLSDGQRPVLVGSEPKDLDRWGHLGELIVAVPASEYDQWRAQSVPELRRASVIEQVHGFDYVRGRWRDMVILQVLPPVDRPAGPGRRRPSLELPPAAG